MPIVVVVLLDEVGGDRSDLPFPHRGGLDGAGDRDGESGQDAPQPVFGGIHRPILGQHDPDVMAEGLERLGQRAGDVGQPSGLGKRGHLGGSEKDLHRVTSCAPMTNDK